MGDDMLDIILSKNAQSNPKGIAFEHYGKKYTFEEVDRRVQLAAQTLLSLGVKPGQRVAHYFERDINLFVFIHALSRVGAVEVPLDTTYPSGLILSNLQETNPCLAVVNSSFDDIQDIQPTTSSAPSLKTRFVYQGDFFTKAAALKPTNINLAIPNNSIAYIAFSSGTSGKPKACEIPRAGQAYWHQVLSPFVDTPKLRSSSSLPSKNRVLSNCTSGFDASKWDIQVAAACGGTLVMSDNHITANPEELVNFMVLHRITHATLVVSIVNEFFLEEGKSRESDFKKLSETGLKTLFLTGAAIPRKVLEAAECYGIEIINCYGPSETCYGGSICRTTLKDLGSQGEVAIGLPNRPEVEYYLEIEDEKSRTTLIQLQKDRTYSEPLRGKLLICAPHGSRGYINNPAKTKELYVQLPIETPTSSPEIGSKGKQSTIKTLFRTGDEVLFYGNKIYWKGSDHVKINGIKVHPFEIEESIRNFPGVGNVAVVVRNKTSNKHFLLAYIVPTDDFDPSKLHERLSLHHHRSVLPRLTTKKALPLTHNHKIDRHALQNEKGPIPLMRWSPVVTPSKNFEGPIKKSWVNLLFLSNNLFEEVSVDDDFYDNGGDSLLLHRLIIQIEDTFGIKIQPDTLAKFTDDHASITIENLAKLVSHQLGVKYIDSSVKCLNKGSSSKNPLFILPDITGIGSLVYTKLRRALIDLDPERPIYTFDFNNLKGNFSSIDDFLEAIKSFIQAEKPEEGANIAGFSMGAFTACLLAKKFEDAEKPVNFLGLIDFNCLPRSFNDNAKFANLLCDLFELLFKNAVVECKLRDYQMHKIFNIQRLQKLSPKEQIQLLLKELGPSISVNTRKIFMNVIDSLLLHSDTTLPKLRHITPNLYWAADTTKDSSLKTQLLHLAGKSTDHLPIPGTHLQLIGKEKAVQSLAEQLNTDLTILSISRERVNSSSSEEESEELIKIQKVHAEKLNSQQQVIEQLQIDMAKIMEFFTSQNRKMEFMEARTSLSDHPPAISPSSKPSDTDSPSSSHSLALSQLATININPSPLKYL